MKQVLQIDPEFRRLSVPLSSEEEQHLQTSLIREGCQEPIAVWNGCILDGHKRYEICGYNEIEYETVQMDFATREDAVIWLCSNRVKSLMDNRLIYKYLLGKWYNVEKEKARMRRKEEKRKRLGLAIKKTDESGQIISIPVDRVSCVVADKIGRTRNAVEKYGGLTKLLEQIAQKDEALFHAIMNEQVPATMAQIKAMAAMDGTRLANTRKKLLQDEEVKMRQRMLHREKTDTKTRPKTESEPLAAPLEMGIKEMPVFDPDMEFRGLALTIPTWMHAIARVQAKTKIEMVSAPAREQLAVILHRLEEQIAQTLEVIEKCSQKIC